MRVDFLKESEVLRARLTEIRETLHRMPEIGDHEFRTAEYIEHVLDDIGIAHHRVLDTGIAARIDGGLPGRHSAIRSDIDALPVSEATGCDFASQTPGMMHACGHDVHMTSLLGAALILHSHRQDLAGSVTLIFQPNEEGDGGAKRMIDAGVLEGVSAVFGAHVDPALPAGHIGVKYGGFYAASAAWKINVLGKSAHGAQRDKGIDAIEAAAHVIPEILAIPGGVVSAGTIHAGKVNNILADDCEMRGIIRTYGLEKRAEMCRELESRAARTAAKFGAKCECVITDSCPGIVNDNDALTSLVETTAREVLGSEHVDVIDKPLFISEDFGFFIMAKTGCFYHIGAGCTYPLHSDKFLPVPEAFITASAVHAAVASKYNSQDW